jgi:hypothetical protein
MPSGERRVAQAQGSGVAALPPSAQPGGAGRLPLFAQRARESANSSLGVMAEPRVT